MKRKRFNPEQITANLYQAESGISVKDLCRKHGFTEGTFYRWKTKYAGMGTAEVYDFDVTKGEVPYWFNVGNDLKLRAYVESETDFEGNPLDFWTSLSVILDLTYAAGTEGPGLYVGKYSITQSSYSIGPGSLTKTFEGAITCEI